MGESGFDGVACRCKVHRQKLVLCCGFCMCAANLLRGVLPANKYSTYSVNKFAMWWPLRATVVCAFYVLASSSCVEEGTAYKHRLLQAQPTLVLADWSACQEKCQQDPLCKGFTFKKPPVSGSGGCWILPQVDAKEADATAMSGPKSCETILTDSVSAKVGTIDTEKVSVGQSDSTMYVILGASIGTALLLTVAVCMMTPAKRGMARGRKGKSGKVRQGSEIC